MKKILLLAALLLAFVGKASALMETEYTWSYCSSRLCKRFYAPFPYGFSTCFTHNPTTTCNLNSGATPVLSATICRSNTVAV
jgi:hypothetical protein